MENKVLTYTFEQFMQELSAGDVYQDQVAIYEIGSEFKLHNCENNAPFRLEAVCVLFVSEGEITMSVDYFSYQLRQYEMFEIYHINLLNSFYASPDVKGYFVIFSRGLIRELIPVLRTIPQEYVLRKNFDPVTRLDYTDYTVLENILKQLRVSITRTEHFFHREMVLNDVKRLIMEGLNIGMRKYAVLKSPGKTSFNEELAMCFANLLVTKGRQWDRVSLYAKELCVTPVYLTRAIKAITGKTVMEWINDVRLSEAKVLLHKSGLSMQDVAIELNFSDQSAFGKFFKKHTGLSPIEYKRKVI